MNEKINLNRLANSFLNASFKKKVVAGLLIIGVILSLGFAAWAGVNITLNLDVEARLDYLAVQQQLLNDTINIPVNSTVSAMMKTVSYIVSVHSTSYCLINGSDDRAGKLEYYSTNATNVINYALGNLTVGRLSAQTVKVLGTISITASSIQLPSLTVLEGPATIRSTDCSKDLITLRDQYNCSEIYVKNIDLMGDGKGSGHAGSGINFWINQTLAWDDWMGDARSIWLEGMKIRYFPNHGIEIACNNTYPKNAGPVVLKDVYSTENGARAIEIYDCSDATLFHVYTAGIYLHHLTSTVIDNCYYGNCYNSPSLEMDFCQRVRIGNTKIDSPDEDGILLTGGCSALDVNNIEMKIGSQLNIDSTYSGIKLVDCDDSIFNNIRISHYSSGGKYLLYGVELTADSDYNVFGTMLLTDCDNGFKVLGTGNKYDASIIIGTIV